MQAPELESRFLVWCNYSALSLIFAPLEYADGSDHYPGRQHRNNDNLSRSLLIVVVDHHGVDTLSDVKQPKNVSNQLGMCEQRAD